MIKKIDQVIEEKIHGMHYGRRLLLPFVADVLKIVIDNDILTDFNFEKSRADYHKEEYFTEINFMDYDNLQKVVSEFEQIKMVVVEDGENIFDFSKHKKITLRVLDEHKILVEEVDDETLFFD